MNSYQLNQHPDWVELCNQGWTLPASLYTDPAILVREQEKIFKRTWQYVGATSSVSAPGQYFTCQIANVPIVVTRGSDNVLRAFVNVCRHRAALIVNGCGNKTTLQCPYHAWTYGLDGTLLSVPRCEREQDFDKSDLGLLPVKVDTWGSFVFVNLDTNSEPLEKYLGILPETMESSGVNLKNLKLHKRTEFDMAANWKVVAENYLECYHCPASHPDFCKLLDADADAYKTYAIDNTLIGKAPLASNHEMYKIYDTNGEAKDSQFTLVWPNNTFGISPGRGNVVAFWFTPLSTNRTYGVFDYYFSEDIDDKFEKDFTVFWDKVGLEDVELVESVQRGLESGMVPQGRLLLDSERLVQYFQSLVYRYVIKDNTSQT